MAGGWIADELGWRQALLIVGLPGVVLAVVFKIVVKEPQRGLADGVRPDPAAAAPPLGDVVRQLFGNASFVHIPGCRGSRSATRPGLPSHHPRLALRPAVA